MTKPFYITTPLYYVNAKPHIGHAYTNVLCDTFARWQRFLGNKVFFLTGTDEHGTKIEKCAKAEGQNPRAFVDEMVPEFEKLWKLLGIEYDFFIRTTDKQHKKVVADVLRNLEAREEIYKAIYEGWYCTPCESFWTERQLKEGKCKDCSREVQKLSEENYFLKLTKHQDWLKKEIEEDRILIRPDYRKNEILGFLREPLEDLSITRLKSRLSWGIDYPNSAEHIVYVWFDALINYVSATRYSEVIEKHGTDLWPANLHMIGKDILRQHAVYWPIMLRAMDLDMPKTILAHGWWTLSGAKVSKSRGNAVDPVVLVQKYGVDAFRYFLLKEVTIGNDGAFSEDLLAERYTTDLANSLGNLWFRFASMLEKYFDKKIPKGDGGHVVLNESLNLWDRVDKAMAAYDPRTSLSAIWTVVTLANQFIEEKKPWVLAKDPSKEGELISVMVILAESIAHIAVILQTFLPATAIQLMQRLGLETGLTIEKSVAFRSPFVKSGTMVERGEALFPKLEEVKE